MKCQPPLRPIPKGGLGPGRAFGGRDWGKEIADVLNNELDSLNTVLTVPVYKYSGTPKITNSAINKIRVPTERNITYLRYNYNENISQFLGALFIDYQQSPFFLRDSRASETRARVKITPREKRGHAARSKMGTTRSLLCSGGYDETWIVRQRDLWRSLLFCQPVLFKLVI